MLRSQGPYFARLVLHHFPARANGQIQRDCEFGGHATSHWAFLPRSPPSAHLQMWSPEVG